MIWESNKWSAGASMDAATAAYLEQIRNDKIVAIVFNLKDAQVGPNREVLNSNSAEDAMVMSATGEEDTVSSRIDQLPILKSPAEEEFSMLKSPAEKDKFIQLMTKELFMLNFPAEKENLIRLMKKEMHHQDETCYTLLSCAKKNIQKYYYIQGKVLHNKKRVCRGRFTRYLEPVVSQGVFSVPMAAVSGNKTVDSLNCALAEVYTQISIILKSKAGGAESVDDLTFKRKVGGLRSFGLAIRRNIRVLGGVPIAEPLAYWKFKYPEVAI